MSTTIRHWAAGDVDGMPFRLMETVPRSPQADRSPEYMEEYLAAMSGAVLQPLVESDLDMLLKVQRGGAIAGLGHIFPQAVYPFPTELIRDRWLAEIADPETDCFAVVKGGDLAGFAATRGAELLHFGTAVQTWGTSLAGRAHDEILEHLHSRGYRTAWLWVFRDNHRAVRFYLRRGWVATGEQSTTEFAPYPALRRYRCPRL